MTEVDINEILKEHVTLDIECIDRIYLNGYIPNLQMPGQVVKFLRQQGYPIPSPALLGKLTDEYKAAVEAFAKEHDSTVVFCSFELDQLAIMATLDLQSSCRCTLPSVTAKQSAKLWWNCRTQKISQPADASFSSPQTTTNWPLNLASGQHGKVRTVRPDLFANGMHLKMIWPGSAANEASLGFRIFIVGKRRA